jgi:hypothetical protein
LDDVCGAFAAALSAKAPKSWTTAEIGKLLASHLQDKAIAAN